MITSLGCVIIIVATNENPTVTMTANLIDEKMDQFFKDLALDGSFIVCRLQWKTTWKNKIPRVNKTVPKPLQIGLKRYDISDQKTRKVKI